MFLHVLKDRQYERLYIRHSVRKGNGVRSENVKSLGRIDSLMKEMNLSREQVLEWAQKQVDQMNDSPSTPPVLLSLSPDKKIVMDEQHSFLAGYLFLQSIYYGLKMKNVFRIIASHSRFDLTSMRYVHTLSMHAYWILEADFPHIRRHLPFWNSQSMNSKIREVDGFP